MTFKPIKPKLAATVILLRNEPPNTEIFMIKRDKNLKFLGGFHAFPGGKLEADDTNLRDTKNFDKDLTEEARQFFQIENKTFNSMQIQSLYMTAIRELFEEVGILLASNNGNKIIDLYSNDTFEYYLELRKKLLKDKLKFSQILKENELSPLYHSLKPFKHFITPELSPIRYDTYFFILDMPDSQKILPISKEIADSIWITPKEAIRKYFNSEILLIPPQLVCLTDLKKLNRRVK